MTDGQSRTDEAIAALDAGAPAERSRAAQAISKLAATADGATLAQVGAALVRRGRVESDGGVVDALSSALLQVWNRDDEPMFETAQRYATDPAPALRLAAAKQLALATPVPLPDAVIPTVLALAADTDDRVRAWAEDALSNEAGPER